ncbi:hypothetical protein D915_003321 [Fasciola hepatica]|uniref:Uncharacterized protein n=1 Tax=Fasciola hepatica TaxID=6192 RepID=A0A4E0S2H8_FASHE|nr:hypothetical protein D915_003321 [Fasciola hepatica]
MNSIKLRLEKFRTKFPLYDEFLRKATKFVQNLSTTELSRPQVEASSLGFNFKCPPKNVHKIYLQASFEQLYEQISELTPYCDDNRNWFKAKRVDLAQSFLTAAIQQQGILRHKHYQSLKQLWNNPNLWLLKPDKEQNVVMTGKEEYITKVINILEDRDKSKPAPK